MSMSQHKEWISSRRSYWIRDTFSPYSPRTKSTYEGCSCDLFKFRRQLQSSLSRFWYQLAIGHIRFSVVVLNPFRAQSILTRRSFVIKQMKWIWSSSGTFEIFPTPFNNFSRPRGTSFPGFDTWKDWRSYVTIILLKGVTRRETESQPASQPVERSQKFSTPWLLDVSLFHMTQRRHRMNSPRAQFAGSGQRGGGGGCWNCAALSGPFFLMLR